MQTLDDFTYRIGILSPPKIQGHLLRPAYAEDLAKTSEMMKEIAEGIAAIRIFKGGGFRMIVSVDNTKHGPLIHASLSHRARIPTWPEITDMKRSIWEPEEDVMMLLPRESDYVNIHEFAMHLWTTPTGWGIR